MAELVGSVESIVSRCTEKNFFKPVRYCMSSVFFLPDLPQELQFHDFTL